MTLSSFKQSSVNNNVRYESMRVGYPATPIIGTATDNLTGTTVNVAFTGVSGATSYTALSTPGSLTATGASSPITVSGLTSGTAYTFQVRANNSIGSGAYSAASNSVTPSFSLVLTAMSASPYIAAYPFSGSGFGTRYSNPATLATGAGNGTAFNRQTSSVAQAHTNSPWVTAWPWTVASGFGTKYSNPASAINATDSLGVTFSPAGDAISVSASTGGNAPYMQAYRWSASGFGTKYTTPAPDMNGPNGAGQTAFNPAGTVIAGSNGGSPWIYAWSWTSASGFGTKFSDPASLPPGGQGISFNPAGTAIGQTYSNATPYLAFYPWSSGFGTRYSAPGTPPPSISWGLSWHPSGNAVSIGHSTTPFISAYAWSSGFGTKFSNPASLPPDTGYGVAFDTAGTNVALSHSTSPFISIYPWSSGFGTKYSNPASLPTTPNGPRGVTFI